MERSYDVVALGELLIDMTMNGKSGQGNALYEANPGGAPCNVLAMLKKLGHKVAFIGKVGDDIFGHELKDVLDEVGIDPKGLIIDKEARTTLAFVKTFEDGDRDFSIAIPRPLRYDRYILFHSVLSQSRMNSGSAAGLFCRLVA